MSCRSTTTTWATGLLPDERGVGPGHRVLREVTGELANAWATSTAWRRPTATWAVSMPTRGVGPGDRVLREVAGDHEQRGRHPRHGADLQQLGRGLCRQRGVGAGDRVLREVAGDQLNAWATSTAWRRPINNLGSCLCTTKGSWDRAHRILREGAGDPGTRGRHPRHGADVSTTWAWSMPTKGSGTGRIEFYEKALAISRTGGRPSTAWRRRYNNLGLVYAHKGEWDRAHRVLREVVGDQ